MKKGFITGVVLFTLFVLVFAGATNFDRIVLGSGNYNSDPNTTADITLQNDEYISNYTDGTITFGSDNIAFGTANISFSGTLDVGSTMAFIDTFATTATTDTHTVAGALPTDIFFVSPRGATVDTLDVLAVKADTNKVIVSRPAGGTSGLPYQVIRVK